jgi:hypothetical protein
MRRNFTFEGNAMSKTRVGLLCAGLLLALACGGKEEETKAPDAAATTPSATPAAQPSEGAAATPQEDSGIPAEVVNGDLPKDYPKDLPVYPGSAPTTSLMAGGSGLIVLNTNAPAAAVLSHYRDELPNQGWTVDEVGEDPPRITAHKDSRNATISITESSEGTEIGIAIEGS